MKGWVVLASLFVTSCAALQNNFLLHQFSISTTDSTFVYRLPYEKGTSHWVVQGSRSYFSHHRVCAVDIKMKQGTKIVAARSGTVAYVVEIYSTGGIGKKYVGRGNGISIKHDDGTYAHYWHLQQNGALVNVGDTVQQGQVIGLSGSTGFSAFPHLHFEVTQQPHKKEHGMPVLFQTTKGVKFLQPLHAYKAI